MKYFCSKTQRQTPSVPSKTAYRWSAKREGRTIEKVRLSPSVLQLWYVEMHNASVVGIRFTIPGLKSNLINLLPRLISRFGNMMKLSKELKRLEMNMLPKSRKTWRDWLDKMCNISLTFPERKPYGNISKEEVWWNFW